MYYETLSQAVDAALSHKLPNFHELDDSIEVTWEPMCYETSQTRHYPIRKLEGVTCKPVNKGLHVSMYRMPSGRYEVTAYVG